MEGGGHGMKEWGPLLSRNVEVALEEVRHLAQGYVDDILIGTNRTVFMGRDQALYQKTGEGGHMPAASWHTMVLRIDTHKRPMRTQLPDSGSRELRRAVRENNKELDRVEGVVIPSWRTTLKA